LIMEFSDYSIHLKELLDDYYNHRIQVDEYRQQRKFIFDEIDKKYNRRDTKALNNEEDEAEHNEETEIVSELMEIKDRSEDLHT
jgi:predicted  nucleic acid-binding Zn-ribbon protein